MISILLMLLVCIMTAFGQVLAKQGLTGRSRGPGFTELIRFLVHPRIIAGMLLVLGAPLIYIQVLKRLGLSGAYGLNGLSYLIVYSLSRLILKERGSALHTAALLLISGGVFIWSI